jgi:hypothetical protein
MSGLERAEEKEGAGDGSRGRGVELRVMVGGAGVDAMTEYGGGGGMSLASERLTAAGSGTPRDDAFGLGLGERERLFLDENLSLIDPNRDLVGVVGDMVGDTRSVVLDFFGRKKELSTDWLKLK